MHSKVDQLERRVADLEKEVQLLKQIVSPVQKQSSIVTSEKIKFDDAILQKEIKQTKEVDIEPIVAEVPKQAVPEETDWEHLIGKVWLPRVFIFVLLLGLIWGFSSAVIAGILTEPVQITIGFIVSWLLLWLGDRQIKNGRDGLGKVLLSGAVSLLTLTTFAMHIVFDMVPGSVAFILNIIWLGLGIKIADRYKSEAIAVLIAFVGYLVPFLIAGYDNTVIVFVAYETIFFTVLFLFAVKRNYKRLFYTGIILWHVAIVIYTFSMPWGPSEMGLYLPIAFGALIQHILISYFSFKKKITSVNILPLVFASLVITTLWASRGLIIYIRYEELITLSKIQVILQSEIWFDLYLLGVIAVYGFIAYKGWKQDKADHLSVALSIAMLSLTLFIYQILDDSIFGTVVYFVQGTLAIYLGCRLKSALQKLMGVAVYVIAALTTFSSLRMLSLFSLETLAWITLIGTLYALYRMAITYHPDDKELSIVIICINAFAHIFFLTHFVEIFASNWSISVKMMSISFAWALYAVAGVVIGVKFDRKSIRLIGMLLLFVTLCKITLIDLQFVTLFIRTILFVGLGVIGLLVSRLFYVKKN